MAETTEKRGAPPPSELRAGNLPAFVEWLRQGQVKLDDAAGQVVLARPVFMSLLRPLLLRVKFDDAYYRRANPDLVQAEVAGVITSLREHYLNFGYFESRLPCFVEVDAAFYSKEYPDVATGILDRTVKSAQYHFEMFGFKEGRLPRIGWSFGNLVIGN